MGAMSHSIEHHIKLNPTINWVETYWLPDVFANRYQRANYQAHMTVSGEKNVLESNQPENRLNRSV